MMNRRSAWLGRGILLLPIDLAIAISNFHIFLFRPETLRKILVDAVSFILGLIGLLCTIFAAISLIRDFPKLRRCY
jgi:tellurite resistance protein TehA-like permease